MAWFNFWPECKASGLIEQDAELTIVSFGDIPLNEEDAPDAFPTGLAVCHWCNGPASPPLDDCCVRCFEKVKRRAATRERAAPNTLRIDFY